MEISFINFIKIAEKNNYKSKLFNANLNYYANLSQIRTKLKRSKKNVWSLEKFQFRISKFYHFIKLLSNIYI